MADQYSMQAFGTPYGPLVAPMIPQGTDVTTPFMTGFQIAAQNNARIRNLERQNQLYALSEQRAQYQHEAEMNKNDILRQSLELQREKAAGMQDIHYETLRLAGLRTDIAENQLRRQIEDDRRKWKQRDAQQSAMQQLGQVETQAMQEGLRPGTEAYKRRIMELSNNFSGQLPPAVFRQAQTNLFSSSNAFWNQNRQALQDQKKNFWDDVKSSVWGDGITTDLRPITNPEQFPKRWYKEPGAFGGTKIDPNYILVPVKNAQGLPVDRPVAVSYLNDLNKRYQGLQKEEAALGTGINRPDMGVYTDHVETPLEQANRIENDPTASDAARAAARAYKQAHPQGP